MTGSNLLSVEEMVKGIKNFNPRMLAKAITYIESTHPIKKEQGLAVLKSLKTDSTFLNRRIAFTGPPGAGKSTLIEKVTLDLSAQNFKVAIFTIDPSSPFHGGALLADKTRMPLLNDKERVFIRPSAMGKGQTGGVTSSTLDVIDLLEAARYDFILIETVGTGQTEIDIKDMADKLVFVLAPGLGDELQAFKKGINEIVDFIIVNKGDGALKPLAHQTARAYQSSFKQKVYVGSSLLQEGLEPLLIFLKTYPVNREERAHKIVNIFHNLLPLELLKGLSDIPFFQQLLQETSPLLLSQKITVSQALQHFISRLKLYLERNK